MANYTPKVLYDAYSNGFSGCIWEQDIYDELVATSKYPFFGNADSQIKNSGKGKLALLFKSVLKFDPQAFLERQTTGDCVSHSTRNACDVSRAVEIDIKGEGESWVTRSATEAIYGCRGHGGQGMSCSRAAQFVSKTGGVILRKNYPGVVDLSTYNSSIGTRWGSSGVPRNVVEVADDHQIKTVSVVRTVEEARDAIANGYAISVCSGYGFSRTRDSKGISNRSGSWSHAMAWTAMDDTRERYDETLFLVQNSWGKWNSGPKVHGQPDGSFWIRERDASGMLSGGGSYVLSNFDGFPPQKIPNYGFPEYL